MLDIYLKVTIEKNWRSQNFDFVKWKNLSPGQFLGSSNLRRYHWILKLVVATWKWKWKIPHTVLERRTLWFSSYKNHKLKVKLWRVGARERRNREFFVPCFFVQSKFFDICILSQCLVYFIHFQNIHPFTCQKTLLHTLLLLIFKTVESFQCILK